MINGLDDLAPISRQVWDLKYRFRDLARHGGG